MGISKFNRHQFEVTVTRYAKLAELNDEKPYQLKAVYITTGNYGDRGVAVVDYDGEIVGVNLPEHLTAVVREMLADPETVEDIRNGRAALQVRPYDKEGRTFYTVSWLEM